MNKLIIIVPMTPSRIIGNNGKLPWQKLDGDLPLFKENTLNTTLLMGRKTFDSLPGLLPRREHVVISSKNKDYFPNEVKVFQELKQGLAYAKSREKQISVIGGEKIYQATLPLADNLYISHVKMEYQGNVHFPEVNWNDWYIEKEIEYQDFIFKTYIRNPN